MSHKLWQLRNASEKPLFWGVRVERATTCIGIAWPKAEMHVTRCPDAGLAEALYDFRGERQTCDQSFGGVQRY
jgi:hypothetical protein